MTPEFEPKTYCLRKCAERILYQLFAQNNFVSSQPQKRIFIKRNAKKISRIQATKFVPDW